VRRPPTDAPFVHVGRAGDPDLRWLVDAPLPPEPCAYLFDSEPTLYASPGADLAGVAGHVVETAEDPSLALVAALSESGVVRAPRHLPHDAALRVEQGGHDLRSTTAVVEARAQKDESEQTALAAGTSAARAGVERAREALSAGPDGLLTVADPGDESNQSTAERLRRRIASSVAAAGATPAVRVEGTFRVGAPVVVDASARVDGRWARVARTLIVGGDGGAVRRAQVAAESALRVAASEASAGTEVDWLADEVRAELGSFGVQPAGARVIAGTGLARREAPLVGTGAALETGNVLVVAPAAQVPDGEAVVRLADTLVVEESGARVLAG
jgi:Xaa-Pro aminopeptidase